MNRPLQSQLLLCALLPVIAHAQSTTYDFTGTVTNVSGIYGSIPIGATVTGTYTFELSNANPAQSSGVVGSTSAPWDAELFGGSYYIFDPTPVSSVVFSSTASVDGFTYASYAPSTYLTNSRVLNTIPPPGSYYEALELICTSSSACHFSVLHGSDLFGIDYTSAGLPLFSANPNGWFGGFSTGPQLTSNDFLSFSITSLTPAAAAPEPSSMALMGLGIAGVWLNRRRRRV